MCGFGQVRDISEELLVEHVNVLFDDIIFDLFKQREEALSAALNTSFEGLKQESKQTLEGAITPETIYGLSSNEIQQNIRSILQPIEDKYKKQRQEIKTNVFAEYKVKLETKIADTQAELKNIFQAHFLLKERQKYASKTPSKYRCF